MDPAYYALCTEALAGTLASTDASGTQAITIKNGLNVDLAIFWLSPAADQWGYDAETSEWGPGSPGYALAPGQSLPLSDVAPKTYFLVTAAQSGAFSAVAWWDTDPSPPTDTVVTSLSLLRPGELGDLPASTTSRPIPGDGPRVLVGSGQSSLNNAPVTREQYWRLSSDSYSLQPSESRTVSSTTSSGMETTSSDSSTFATALGVSSSATAKFGWGQVSASVSASLSYSSSTFQQVTLNSQTVNFVSLSVEPPSEPTLVLMWQICDVITVFDPTTKEPAASTVSLLLPQIGVSTSLATLPTLQAPSSLSVEEMARAAPTVSA
jgi:hypothetical protein